jgi:lipoprotein-releasing system ATP-binding protein
MENVLLPRLALGTRARGRRGAGDATAFPCRTVRAAHRTCLRTVGGERQRVAVARALMNEPTLVLADEPTGNLDARSADAVGDLLAGVTAENRAILIVVTHSDALASRFARACAWPTDGWSTHDPLYAPAAQPRLLPRRQPRGDRGRSCWYGLY